MAQLKAFSIRDLKAGAFSAPFFAPSVGEGERVFLKLARNQETNIAQFPADFQLFLIGDFEQETAEIRHQKPQHLLDASAATTA